jgi:parallel beta-helix repeat protein
MRLFFLAGLSLFCSLAQGIDLYVMNNAQAGGDGSQARPFQSLTQARDAIRTARAAKPLQDNQAITITLAPGIYQLETSFELTAADSGTAKAPVTYRAAKAGSVRLQGGLTLPATAFRKVTEAAVLARLDATIRDQVLVCDLSGQVPKAFEAFKDAYQATPAAPWLYCNGQPMTLARWPNNGWAEFAKAVDTGLPKADATDPALKKLHPGSFIFDNDRPARWNLQEGVWLCGYWCHDWSDEVIRVAAYDPQKKVISLAAPHHYGIMGGTWGAAKRRFFALNALEELDAPGEWYLDRPRKQLYFYPPGPATNATMVLATLTQPLLKVNGAKHLRFEGLNFEYSHGNGIVLDNTEDITVAGCTIANLAGTGISVNGSRNTIRSCDLFNLGRGGLSLNGGNREKLTRADNLAENNHIHHYGLFQRTYAAGINANGCGQIARHNAIHDAPHNAVLYGGNEQLFELNDVYRVVMETGDAGAFYSGRDWTSQGNVIRHNFIHDLGGGDAAHANTMGVYLDDCDSGDTIDGNVFVRSGRAVMIGGGRDNLVLNNLIVDCPIGLHLDSRGTTWKQWNNPTDTSWCLEEKAKKLNYTQPPWSTAYPKLAAIMAEDPRQPLGNVVRRNVLVDCQKEAINLDANARKLFDRLEVADNLAVDRDGTNPKARGCSLRGFRSLAKPSPETARETGPFAMPRFAWIPKELPVFQTIPFSQIGLYKDAWRTTLPAR